MTTTPVRDIEPEILQRLGLLATRSALVESLLAEFFPAEIRSRHHLRCEPERFWQHANWLGTILCNIRFTDESTVKGLNELLTMVDHARAERNVLVHGLWSTQTEPGAVYAQTIKWERSEVVRHELVTVADLDELIHHVNDIAGELDMIGRKLGLVR